MLKADTASRIADYFGVSLDYLLGRTSQKEMAGAGKPHQALKSIARIEGNKISPEEDNAITAFVDFLLAEREKEGE